MKKSGFSFIELIVVVGLLLSITGFIVGNYNNFISTERLRQAGKTLRTDLRYAQTQATSGVKPANCTNANQSLRGYTVTFTGGDPSTYTLRAICTNNLTFTLPQIQLPRGVTYQTVPPVITFQVLSGTVDTTYTIVLSSVGKTYRIQVSPSGDINDLGLL